MASIGVQDQASAGHAARQQPVVGSRVELVQRSVGNQRGDPDLAQPPAGGVFVCINSRALLSMPSAILPESTL